MKVICPDSVAVGVHPEIEGIMLIFDQGTDNEHAVAITNPAAALKIAADLSEWGAKLQTCAEFRSMPVEGMARG